MSLLPNLREYDDVNLAELLSDSEELLMAKFKERTRRRREVCEQQEQEEWEVWEACERRSHEEREQTACKEVHRGKVSAQRLK